MDIFIISLIVSLAILIVLYKFAKGVLRIIGFAFFILMIILAIFTVFIFLDIRDMKNHASERSVELLVKDGRIIAGHYISFDDASELSEDEISSADISYNRGDMDSLRNDTYKVYLMDYSAVAADIDILSIKVAEENVSAMLDSESSQRMRNAIYSALLFSKAAEDPLFLFTEYRKGNIEVYPETALFKFMKYVPSLVIERAKFIVSERKGAALTENGEVQYAKV